MTPEDPTPTERQRWLAAVLNHQGLALAPTRLAELARAQELLERYTAFLRRVSPLSVQQLEPGHDA